MKDKRFVVLVVEDSLLAQADVMALLSPHAEVLQAFSLREALVHIHSRGDIDFVILDWLVPMFRDEAPRNSDTTAFLVPEIQEHLPTAKMFSASSAKECNDKLVSMGCVRSTKHGAPQVVLDMIQETQIS